MGYFHTGDGRNSPRRLLIAARFDNGTVGINYYNTEEWHGQSFPTLSGTTYDNWTSISVVAATNLLFFGLTGDGEIHEYTMDRTNPLSWTYNSQVSVS
jgi:hypothetical protein